MRSWTLLSQVLAVNAGLVVVTALVASLAQTAATLAVGVLAVLALNSILLRDRLAPLQRLVETMAAADLSKPVITSTEPPPPGTAAAKEIRRLQTGFVAMLQRLGAERQAANRAVLEAQERERARIALDLHDEVNQSLTGVKLRLSALAHDAPDDLAAGLRDLQAVTDTAMNELLRLTRELRPSALHDLGLVSALRSQVVDFGDRTGIHADFSRLGVLRELTEEQQLVAFRITQESLSNVAQHARASTVAVELRGGKTTTLRVVDDGAGFDGPARDGALGLSGMRERALLVGGALTIRSRPGYGTTVELTMDTA